MQDQFLAEIARDFDAGVTHPEGWFERRLQELLDEHQSMV